MVKSRKVHSLTGRITIELMRAAFSPDISTER